MFQQSAQTLVSHLRVDFHRTLLFASIAQLSKEVDPLAFNSFCASFRELIRHVLTELASDEEIKRCPWFKPDETSNSGITRSHAVHYTICGGLSEEYVANTLKIDISASKREIAQAFKMLNKFTHLNEATFNIAKEDYTPKALEIINALTEVLQHAEDCRNELRRALSDRIERSVVSAAISETLGAIDEIATHHFIDGIDVAEIEVTKIGSEDVEISVCGDIEVELQWGSNSDVSNDIGVVAGDSFPFHCTIITSTSSPEDVSVDAEYIHVDTSSWFGEESDYE